MSCKVGMFVMLSSVLLFSSEVDAAAARTFVATTGSDTNTSANCAPTAPCRTFSAALSVTASGGEVVVLNSGGYGPTTITQSVTITAPDGVYAGISVPAGADGIVISGTMPSGASIDVTLRGLAINSLSQTAGGTGGRGINIVGASTVRIVRCSIRGMPVAGVYGLADPSSTQATQLALYVQDSEFVQEPYEFYLAPNAAMGTIVASFRNVTMDGGGQYTSTARNGIYQQDGVTTSIANSQIAGYLSGIVALARKGAATALVASGSVLSNGYADVAASVTSGVTVVDLRNNMLTTSSPVMGTGQGAVAVCGGAQVSLYANTISENPAGVFFETGCSGTSVVSSFDNNGFIGNGTDVAGGSLTSITSK
jgi:hypothetical protein